MSTAPSSPRVSVPRQSDDYTHEAAAARREFLREQAGASLEHVGTYSQDPSELPGNIEHFTGVAQVPLGVAGVQVVLDIATTQQASLVTAGSGVFFLTVTVRITLEGAFAPTTTFLADVKNPSSTA